MTTYLIRYFAAFLLVLITRGALSQQVDDNKPDSTALFPTTHGVFEHYVFILNGGIIEQHELVNYPGARLDRIFPYRTPRKDKYQGVVYFHTPWYPPSPPDQHADDPAYFINGIQVSPYAIRSSNSQDYIRIERSGQDTVIDGTLYSGSIHVDTDEDFFADRIALPELIEKYTGLPLTQVIVHWRSRFIDELNPGVMIHDHFPIYYINPKGLQEVKVDRVQFAEGERYLVHLVDKGYRYNNFTKNGWRAFQRTLLIFDDPVGSCYFAEFDTTGKDIYQRTKEEPKPFQGEAAYLKKLSAIMGLPVDKPHTAKILDSITVQFIVLGNGQLTGLASVSPREPEHASILQAIKQHSCVWSVARGNGKPLIFRRKMVLFYSKDQKGDICSLDALEYL